MVRSRGVEPPRGLPTCTSSMRVCQFRHDRVLGSAYLTCPFYFFGGVCGGFGFAFGFGGMFKGMVSVAPLLGALNRTEGCPGFPGPVLGVIETGAPVTAVTFGGR